MTVTRMPTLFIPHGGGPCFFMDDPAGNWRSMEAFLKGLSGLLPAAPRAILVVSGHWETAGFAFTSGVAPDLIYDYFGFPPHTYEITYPVSGAPDLAARAGALIAAAGIEAAQDPMRGLDHGVFVPLKVAFPEAAIPVVEMSVERGLDPELHRRAGAALAPLRDEGVLIVGSGMSFHNMRAYGRSGSTAASAEFDRWLTDAVGQPAAIRAPLLADWASAPSARFSHPREEHLIPLMVAAGAAEGPGTQVFGDEVLDTFISGYRFD